MLDLVLVNAPSPQLEDDCMAPPVGLIELATHAIQSGYTVKIIDAAGDIDFHAQIVPARVYGFTVQSTQYKWVIDAITRLRAQLKDTRIVIGGHHTSALPADTLKDTRADQAVVGDGEHALVSILSGKETSSVVIGEEADVNHPYSPNYDFIDFGKYSRRINGSKAMTVMASRSCPYACHFCAKLPGSRFRYRDAQLVLQDIRYIKDTYRISAIHFHDDNLLFPRKRAITLAKGLKDLGITWRCLTRADSVEDESFVRLIKECGCHEVCFGIESGSDRILKLLNKGTTVAQNKQAIQLCRKAGLNVDAYLMINVPGERWKTLSSQNSSSLKPSRQIGC
jgi:radical SAM superfamily enzyme YgiQ (UPF0313 family)